MACRSRLPAGNLHACRGLTLDDGDNTLYITNFARTTGAFYVPSEPEEGHPAFGPSTLTMVDLSSAPLDRQEGTFTYEEVTVGYGPCSVVMFDLDKLSPAERARRAEYIDTDA